QERPEWAATIHGTDDSAEKLARKDQEIRLADKVFVASSFTAQTLRDYPDSLPPVEVIPYGFPPPVENRTYDKATNRPLRALFVGGLSQRKGIAETFEAVAPFGDRVELTILGRKPTDKCALLNDALKRHRYIPSLPHHEVLALMRTQDILLFPSHFEGFGLVITEAMSQGTPVITTERTAGQDLISDGEDGFLTNAGNVEGIVSVLDQLLSRPQDLAEHGRAASKKALSRPWDKYSQELADAITTTIA
ncbi:MAG: glycosyltransferase family 4 protein, partial [Bacteroidota bacterium]